MENFYYLCSMNIQEYLKQCSVKSVDELSDKQVLAYFHDGNAGVGQKCAVDLALRGYSECGFTMEQVMSSIRKAMKTKAKFGMTYITNESAIGPSKKKSRWVIEP